VVRPRRSVVAAGKRAQSASAPKLYNICFNHAAPPDAAHNTKYKQPQRDPKIPQYIIISAYEPRNQKQSLTQCKGSMAAHNNHCLVATSWSKAAAGSTQKGAEMADESDGSLRSGWAPTCAGGRRGSPPASPCTKGPPAPTPSRTHRTHIACRRSSPEHQPALKASCVAQRHGNHAAAHMNPGNFTAKTGFFGGVKAPAHKLMESYFDRLPYN